MLCIFATIEKNVNISNLEDLYSHSRIQAVFSSKEFMYTFWLAFDKKAISFEDDIEIGIWEIFWSYSILLWQVLSRILIRRDLWTQILSWKRASKNFSFMNKTEAFTQKTFQNPPSNLVQDPIKTLRQDTLKPLKTFSRPFVKKKIIVLFYNIFFFDSFNHIIWILQ